MRSSLILAIAAIAAMLVTACSKEEAVVSPKFDAKFIAAEADKGNLAPLEELNKACSEEVQKSGQRQAACRIQDDVGKLVKPLSIRF